MFLKYKQVLPWWQWKMPPCSQKHRLCFFVKSKSRDMLIYNASNFVTTRKKWRILIDIWQMLVDGDLWMNCFDVNKRTGKVYMIEWWNTHKRVLSCWCSKQWDSEKNVDIKMAQNLHLYDP